MTRRELEELIRDRYCISADYPFEGDGVTAVFRHGDNRKWFAIAMHIPRKRLGLSGDGYIDVVNVKVAPEMTDLVGAESGVYPAYHMNRAHWLTLALDGSASDETAAFLLGVSFDLTRKKIARCRRREEMV